MKTVVIVSILNFNSLLRSAPAYSPFPVELKRPEMLFRTCAANNVQHFRSLISIFARHILDSQGFQVSPCGLRRIWSDCADAQPDFSVRWALMPEGMFYHDAANFVSLNKPVRGSLLWECCVLWLRHFLGIIIFIFFLLLTCLCQSCCDLSMLVFSVTHNIS